MIGIPAVYLGLQVIWWLLACVEVLIHTSVAGATISEPGNPPLHVKLRVHSYRRKETVTAHAEDSRLFFCLQTIQAAVCGARNRAAATIMCRSMKLGTKRFSFSVLNHPTRFISLQRHALYKLLGMISFHAAVLFCFGCNA